MPIHPDPDLELDIDIALRTSVPVLISGPPDDTMRVAMVIAGSNANGAGGVMVVAGAGETRFILPMLDADAAGGSPCRMVLREIEKIDRGQQECLIETILTRCRTAAPPQWRLITTTSVPLASQVAAGAFAPRLFYLLNAIHIIV